MTFLLDAAARAALAVSVPPTAFLALSPPVSLAAIIAGLAGTAAASWGLRPVR